MPGLDPGPAVARGRLAAESLMVDACTIRRKTGETTDTDTAAVTPTYATLYTGKCRIQQVGGIARPTQAGEQTDWMLRLDLQLPMSVTGLKVSDVVAVTASVRDPDLPGRVFTIRGLAHKTDATARRVQIEEVT